MNTRLRVLVVEDSLTVRRAIVDALRADADIEVVGEAGDGALGIALCAELRPDVATFDMVLPGRSGLEAVEHIMAYCPTPIVIVSASTNRGELFQTYEALAAGAVDVLEKPRGDEPVGVWERKLVATVKLVARIKVITHVRARLRDQGSWPCRVPATSHADPAKASGSALSQREAARGPTPRVVAIGASTGGPGAVATVLRGLPRGFPLPVLVVIHIAAPFGTALAEWLGTQASLPVGQARDGEPLPVEGEARVLVAPPDRHMIVRRGRVVLTSDAERNHCRPSVDALFDSLAQELGDRTIAALLTGMGKDGAAGLAAIRHAGGATLAQDEATSVVYGMPREAAMLGAAQQVLPIQRIAPTILTLSRGAPS
jgi:two-component system chemotaxis response regulator CheB